jgi:hypothetical protein
VTAVSDTDLLERLRTELPRLLREHPEVRHEIWGLMLEAFPSRQEFLEVLREIRAFREETTRRFEGVIAELREQRLHLAALGGRVGRGLESVVQGVVEEFAGTSFPSAERLVLVDSEGELFGVRGAAVEFDLYAHDGSAYLVEVKSHLKPNDVLVFHRKAAFAEARLGRPVTRLVLALSMEPGAEDLLRRLGIRYRVRAVLD